MVVIENSTWNPFTRKLVLPRCFGEAYAAHRIRHGKTEEAVPS
jgi:hypothetical protein